MDKKTLIIEIAELEADCVYRKLMLDHEIQETIHKLNPLNLLKESVNGFKSNKGIKDELIGATAGLTIGALTKFILIGNSHNPVKKIVGTAVQFGVSMAITKNPKLVVKVAGGLLSVIKKLMSKSSNRGS